VPGPTLGLRCSGYGFSSAHPLEQHRQPRHFHGDPSRLVLRQHLCLPRFGMRGFLFSEALIAKSKSPPGPGPGYFWRCDVPAWVHLFLLYGPVASLRGHVTSPRPDNGGAFSCGEVCDRCATKSGVPSATSPGRGRECVQGSPPGDLFKEQTAARLATSARIPT
jgi:hypothetical protein